MVLDPERAQAVHAASRRLGFTCSIQNTANSARQLAAGAPIFAVHWRRTRRVRWLRPWRGQDHGNRPPSHDGCSGFRNQLTGSARVTGIRPPNISAARGAPSRRNWGGKADERPLPHPQQFIKDEIGPGRGLQGLAQDRVIERLVGVIGARIRYWQSPCTTDSPRDTQRSTSCAVKLHAARIAAGHALQFCHQRPVTAARCRAPGCRG